MKHLQLISAFLLAFVASAFTFQSAPPAGNRPLASDYLLELDGIKGESKQEGHKDWIEIASVSWGANTAAITRQSSRCSAEIKKAADQRRVFDKVRIDQRKPDGSYLQYELENVLITSYQTSSSSGARPMESLSINFTKITYK